MELKPTYTFRECFKSLPKEIKKKCRKQLKLLLENHRYPSLRTKKIEGEKDIFEARVNKKFRFTYQVDNGYYVLRVVKNHEEALRNP